MSLPASARIQRRSCQVLRPSALPALHARPWLARSCASFAPRCARHGCETSSLPSGRQRCAPGHDAIPHAVTWHANTAPAPPPPLRHQRPIRALVPIAASTHPRWSPGKRCLEMDVLARFRAHVSQGSTTPRTQGQRQASAATNGTQDADAAMQRCRIRNPPRTLLLAHARFRGSTSRTRVARGRPFSHTCYGTDRTAVAHPKKGA